MPIKLSQLAAKSKKLEIEFNGDVFNVEYNPFEINSSFWDWINQYNEQVTVAAEKAEDAPADAVDADADDEVESNFNYDVILKVIKRWDLADDDNKELPITLELLRTLPSIMTSHIVAALFEDVSESAKKKMKVTSDAG